MSTDQSFWGRRKAGVVAEAEAEQAALEAETFAEEQQSLEDLSDADILEELDLPDPDGLKMGDDFTAFMAKAVPDRIRRRALRTLWRSNPVLANVDMLVDYGEDFTDKATVVENLQTAYQVGKGMLKHVEEMARQAEERENPKEPEVLEEEEDEVLVAESLEETPEDAPTLVEDDTEFVEDDTEADAEIDELAFVAPIPRRMKFRTEENAA